MEVFVRANKICQLLVIAYELVDSVVLKNWSLIKARCSGFGQFYQGFVAYVLTSIKVKFFEEERVRVVCNHLHGVFVDVLAVSEAEHAQLGC